MNNKIITVETKIRILRSYAVSGNKKNGGEWHQWCIIGEGKTDEYYFWMSSKSEAERIASSLKRGDIISLSYEIPGREFGKITKYQIAAYHKE